MRSSLTPKRGLDGPRTGAAIAFIAASALLLSACTSSGQSGASQTASTSSAPPAAESGAPQSTRSSNALTTTAGRELSCGTILGLDRVKAIAAAGHTLVGAGSFNDAPLLEDGSALPAASRTLRCVELDAQAVSVGTVTFSEYAAGDLDGFEAKAAATYGTPDVDPVRGMVYSLPKKADGSVSRFAIQANTIIQDDGRLNDVPSIEAFDWSLTPEQFEAALPASSACESYLHFDVPATHDIWPALETRASTSADSGGFECFGAPPIGSGDRAFWFQPASGDELTRFDATGSRGVNLDGAPIYPYDGPGSRIRYDDGFLMVHVTSTHENSPYFVRRSHTWLPASAPTP